MILLSHEGEPDILFGRKESKDLGDPIYLKNCGVKNF